MDKHLHLRILDVLQQNNAIGHMVDIKPAFADQLDTQEGRKNFKAQIDFLAGENLIETVGKFDFLTWELLSGLYPIENKKIEARLVGNWASYLAKRGTTKRDATELLPPTPPPAPTVKLGLYDAPSTVLPYPGVNVNKSEPTPEPVKPIAKKEEDDDFFRIKTQNAANHPDADKFLKEEDFLPFKTRKANKPKFEAPIPADEAPILISKHPHPEPLKAPAQEPYFTPPAVPEPVKKPGLEPFGANQTTYTAPNTDEPKPTGAELDFSIGKTTYSPPKSEIRDTAITVKPFTPNKLPANPDQDEKPARIQVSAKRKNVEEEEAPIITARTAKRPPSEPQYTPEPLPPVKEIPAASVVNLRSSATAYQSEPVRAPQASTYHNTPLPPSSSNYAAVRFDTENNPFNSLGTITLESEETKKAKQPTNWGNILKWIIIVFLSFVAIGVLVVLKKRYG